MTRLYAIDVAHAAPAPVRTLTELSLQERAHLQEWLIKNPDILGDVIIVTAEYDRWAGQDGIRAKDRLDILALDTSGRLAVCELKRDQSGGNVHLQAITYAGLASRFDEETLVDAYHAFRTARGEKLTRVDAATRLLEHIGGEFDLDVLRRPRIVLVAGHFPPQVTHTAVWLNEMGVSVTLLQHTLWQVGPSVLAGFTQLYPRPELEGFTLAPAQAAASAVENKASSRAKAATAVARIVDADLLADGAVLHLTPTHATNDTTRAAIEAWVNDDPTRATAVWSNNSSGPLLWNGTGWLPTTLARHILLEAAGVEAPIRGTTWWTTEDGTDLATLAEGLSGSSAKDWSELHQVLSGVPAGRWTTYGDVAKVVGTGPQALGSHVARCEACVNGHRLLNAQGRPSPGFVWSDPDDERSQEEALAEEGVRFIAGTADPTARMASEKLAAVMRSAPTAPATPPTGAARI